MAPSLALVTAASARGHDPDEPRLVDALTARGARADLVDWDDGTADWATYDLVVLRSTWDYVERLEEFRAWLARVDALTVVGNPIAMVTWSLDKHYLAELAGAGVPVVTTTFVEPGDTFRPLPSTEPPSTEYVVKPAIGAGSRDAARYRTGLDDDVATRHAERLLAAGRSVLVQPYLARVDATGETPMVYLDGTFSHAARKRVVLPRAGSLVESLFAPEDNQPSVATPAQRAVADAAMAAIPAALGRPLYARVDLVLDDAGAPCVLELELAEPSLFLPEHPGAADRAARAFISAARAASGGARPGAVGQDRRPCRPPP